MLCVNYERAVSGGGSVLENKIERALGVRRTRSENGVTSVTPSFGGGRGRLEVLGFGHKIVVAEVFAGGR